MPESALMTHYKCSLCLFEWWQENYFDTELCLECDNTAVKPDRTEERPVPVKCRD